jgi:hypothetical protein
VEDPPQVVDVDYLGWVFHVQYGWPNVHRALFHNVWWLLLAVLLAVHAWRKWNARTRLPVAAFLRARPGWALVHFFYASHLFLDLFAGGLTLATSAGTLGVGTSSPGSFALSVAGKIIYGGSGTSTTSSTCSGTLRCAARP